MHLEMFGKLSQFLWPLLQETFDVLDDPHGNSEVALRDDPCCDAQAERGFVAFNEIARIFQRLNSEPLFESANDAECLISVIAKVVHREFFDVLVGNPEMISSFLMTTRITTPSRMPFAMKVVPALPCGTHSRSGSVATSEISWMILPSLQDAGNSNLPGNPVPCRCPPPNDPFRSPRGRA